VYVQTVALGKDLSTGALAKHLRGHTNIPSVSADLAEKVDEKREQEAKDSEPPAGSKRKYQQTMESSTKGAKKRRFAKAILRYVKQLSITCITCSLRIQSDSRPVRRSSS
jgi:hypothetical protein